MSVPPPHSAGSRLSAAQPKLPAAGPGARPSTTGSATAAARAKFSECPVEELSGGVAGRNQFSEISTEAAGKPLKPSCGCEPPKVNILDDKDLLLSNFVKSAGCEDCFSTHFSMLGGGGFSHK